MAITLEEAIEILKNEYEKALLLEHVNQPLAYALYHTWRYVDKKEKHRRQMRKENNNA